MSMIWPSPEQAQAELARRNGQASDQAQGQELQLDYRTPQFKKQRNIGGPEALALSTKTAAKSGILGIEQMILEALNKEPGERDDILRLVQSFLGRPTEQDFETLGQNYQRNAQESQEISHAQPAFSFLGDILGTTAAFAPTLAIPGGKEARIAQLLKGPLSKAGPGAAKFLNYAEPLAARGAIENFAPGYAAYTDNPQDRLMHGLKTAGIGAALNTGIGTGLHAIKRAPANALRGTLSEENLLGNLEAARGTNANLGQVIQNPGLNEFYENVVSKVPGSGAAKATQETARHMERVADEIASQLKPGEIPEGLTEQQALHHKLYEGLMSRVKEAGEKYKNVNDMAIQTNANHVPLSNEYARAKAILEEAKTKPRTEKAIEGALKKELQNIVKGQQPATFIEAHHRRSDWLKAARDIPYTENKKAPQIYNELAEAVRMDMDKAAEASGSNALKNSYNQARNYWVENVLPYQTAADRKIFQREPSLPGQQVRFDEAVSEALADKIITKTKGRDYSGKLKHFTQLLDDQGRALLRSHHFKNAIGENGQINPTELIKSFDALGPKQKAELFYDKPEIMGSIVALKKMKEVNPTAFNTMFNPPTGQKALSWGWMAAWWSASKSLAPVFGPVAPVVAGLGLSIGSRAAKKVLTSEKVREGLIKQMLSTGEYTAGLPNKLGANLGGRAGTAEYLRENTQELGNQ